jgi:ribosomal-protein-serine acetyltransferase
MFIHKIDENLSLKLVELKDAERIFQLTDSSRQYLRQWLPWLDFTKDVHDTVEFIKSGLKGYGENISMNSAIIYNNEIVGLASFNRIDWFNKIAYIGYWLGEDYQGNGIMTKVAHALTDYAITELHLNRVDIRAAVENSKSRAIPERLGFTYEGCIRQGEWLYDHYVDHAVYSMLATEWQNKQAASSK